MYFPTVKAELSIDFGDFSDHAYGHSWGVHHPTFILSLRPAHIPITTLSEKKDVVQQLQGGDYLSMWSQCGVLR